MSDQNASEAVEREIEAAWSKHLGIGGQVPMVNTAFRAGYIAALERSAADSRRLDWLEKQEALVGRYIWEHDNPPRKDPYPSGHFMACDHKHSPFYGDTYRQAIDAAMTAKPL